MLQPVGAEGGSANGELFVVVFRYVTSFGYGGVGFPKSQGRELLNS